MTVAMRMGYFRPVRAYHTDAADEDANEADADFEELVQRRLQGGRHVSGGHQAGRAGQHVDHYLGARHGSHSHRRRPHRIRLPRKTRQSLLSFYHLTH